MMIHKKDSPAHNRRPHASGHIHVIVCMVFVLLVAAQAAGVPAVLECFTAAISGGVPLMQFAKASEAKRGY